MYNNYSAMKSATLKRSSKIKKEGRMQQKISITYARRNFIAVITIPSGKAFVLEPCTYQGYLSR